MAVPVRSAVFGVTLGVAALTASLVFASSLGHLLGTPRLSGFTWDAYVAGRRSARESRRGAAGTSQRSPGTPGGGFTPVRIGDVELMALTLGGTGPAACDHRRGGAGRRHEIALGAPPCGPRTPDRATVTLVPDQAGQHPRPVRMRVIGTAIIPPNPYLTTGSAREPPLRYRAWPRIDPGAARAAGRAALPRPLHPRRQPRRRARRHLHRPQGFRDSVHRRRRAARQRGQPGQHGGRAGRAFGVAGIDSRRDAGPHPGQFHSQKAP